MDLWTCGGADASVAFTWFSLRHVRLKAVVLQPTVVSSFESFVLRSSFPKLPPFLPFFFRGQRVAVDTRTAGRNFNSGGGWGGAGGGGVEN